MYLYFLQTDTISKVQKKIFYTLQIPSSILFLLPQTNYTNFTIRIHRYFDLKNKIKAIYMIFQNISQGYREYIFRDSCMRNVVFVSGCLIQRRARAAGGVLSSSQPRPVNR